MRDFLLERKTPRTIAIVESCGTQSMPVLHKYVCVCCPWSLRLDDELTPEVVWLNPEVCVHLEATNTYFELTKRPPGGQPQILVIKVTTIHGLRCPRCWCENVEYSGARVRYAHHNTSKFWAAASFGIRSLAYQWH